ncbi:acetyltransferase (GNAT) family protein [Paenibacillus cellulosilyticus]|uniref:Acetyltransferase (GNAT) family protein n=1 Tax=Paenibacillus cellulosilyticus TaxID=375489 RepID=A0A2V2YLU5_9BACL|nr:GNAT family N-acetyltransferase [Paenibacillus cellulosilyticus]PWV95235.1 acetyltransferase (GNAT) family protein [Paenibacillus cellulosilyticus]QKS46019.1 GNAT family N-acetyltransferase [Paenibacillus cellulosilyticus]
MAVSLERISLDGLDTLKNLFELVAYDLSEWSGANINDNGLYLTSLDVRSLVDDSDYDLFFVRVDAVLAGFVVVKYLREEDLYYLNHFFILRKFRRQGVGKEAAIMVFDLHIGKWRVSEFEWNTPAQHFWIKVIRDYTMDQFVETRRKDNKGPAQEFMNVHLQVNHS